MTSRDRIRGHLTALGEQWRRAEIREKAVYAGAAACLTLAVGLVLAQLTSASLAITFVATALVLAIGVAVFWTVRSLGTMAGHLMGLARMAENLAPELGSAPSSAVDLETPDTRGYSRELAEDHFDRTAEALARARLAERLAAERRARDRRAWQVLAGSGVLLLVALIGMKTGRARLAGWLADPTAARVSETPLASDITLTYRYPAYTQLAQRIVEGGDGSITAVVGTEVDLSAVADTSVRSGLLRLYDAGGKALQDVQLNVDGRKLAGVIPVMHDGTYAFELTTRGGERLQDGKRHPIHAVPDANPEIVMDAPMEDVELKDDRSVDILWHAKDDFGVGEVVLVIEKPAGDPLRMPLPASADSATKTREGSTRWDVAGLNMQPGEEVRFHLETLDNDTINGPKKGVSETRRLTIFSAKQRHEELLAEQRAVLDEMVALLAAELEHPFPREDVAKADKAAPDHQAIVEKQQALIGHLRELTAALHDDKLSTPQVIAAFDNVREHIETANRERVRYLGLLTKPSRDPALTGIALRRAFADTQSSAVKQLETDILYLDDLLAIQNIEELKEAAKDLHTAQHDMQKLISDYARTKDPALRAELQKRIAEMRDRMQQLVAKMGQIKQRLPAEYRNMESSKMLETEDQMDRLSRLIDEGKLDEAAKELEQLANSVDQLMENVDQAEKEYGGERYDELRKELGEFAKDFRAIEEQQKELADKSEQMLKEYRKNAAARAGKSLDDLVKKAREKTAEALREIDTIERGGLPRYGQLQKSIADAHQRLADMDSLLEQKDFAEARQSGQHAEDSEREMEGMLNDRIPYGGRETRAQQEQAAKSADRALERTREVNAMLDKLFPDPREVLSQEQMQQLARNQKRQAELEQQAKQLAQKMDELSGEMPLFGGEQLGQLQSARGEMGKAVGQMQGGKLPGAAASERRAADALGQLREQLEKASQGNGGGGIPLPLGGSKSGGGSGSDPGGNGRNSQQDVKIPLADKNRASPRYRQELLEAAKQKAPQNYEDAVRKYYEELIK